MSDASAKDRVRQQYGAVGDAYVRSTGHATGNDLARLVDLLQPQPHERALDIATGGGHVAKALAPYVQEIVASDLTPEMLAEAERFLIGLGIGNVRFALADAEELPFDDASFQIVTCRIAPHHFPHPERFVADAARVLAPGGRFGLIDSVVPPGELGERYNAFEAARDPSHVRSLSEEEWAGMLVNAGFTVRTAEIFTKRHDFVDWTDRALVPPEGREAVARILLDLGQPAIDRFQLAVDAVGNLTAFTDEKALFVSTKPSEV